MSDPFAFALNRRQFLQALLGLGAAIALPGPIAEANDAAIDAAWTDALAKPWYFEVSEFGTILEADYVEPRFRSEVWDLWDRQPRTPEHLIAEVEQIAPLVSAFQTYAEERCEIEAALGDPDEGWKLWIRTEGEPGIDRFWDFVDEWLGSKIDVNDYDWFPHDAHAGGRAYKFFLQLDPDLADALAVEIVEGDHPGSDYFAAELRQPIDEANTEAARLGLPFRFRGEVYSPMEHALLAAWFRNGRLNEEEQAYLAEQGFDRECEMYSPLAAWVASFALSDIQGRLPNCGIVHSDGRVVLTRPIKRKRESRKVIGLSQFLFCINWADSGPGISWPAQYRMVWLPGFDRFVVTDSADCDEVLGYCDFALGSFGAGEDWRDAVGRIVIKDWNSRFMRWDHPPWAYFWDAGLVSGELAEQWRREAWQGHEEYAEVKEDGEEFESDDAAEVKS